MYMYVPYMYMYVISGLRRQVGKTAWMVPVKKILN